MRRVHAVILLLGFVVTCFFFKLKDAQQVYFWDEILYGCAIEELESKDICFAPQCIDPEYSRGHPIAYHFFTANFNKFFGLTKSNSKMGSIIIYAIFLLVFFFICESLYDHNIALFLTICLGLHEIVYTQATFFLPEIWMGLFTLLSFHAYLSKKHLLLLVYLSLALLSKESAIVLPFCFGLHMLIVRKFDKKILITLMLSLLSLVLYFSAQYIYFGWILFPLHTSLIELNIIQIFVKVKSCLLDLARPAMGVYLLILSSISIIVVIKKRFKLSQHLLLSLIILFAYIIFCSINFYSARYIIMCIPFLLLFCAEGLKYILTLSKYSLLLIVAVIASQYVRLQNTSHALDTSMGHNSLIEAQKNAMKYIQNNISPESTIYTHFIFKQMLSLECAGWNNLQHKNFSDNLHDADLIISSSYHDSKQVNQQIQQNIADLKLLQSFQHSGQVCNIYVQKSASQSIKTDKN